MDTEYIERLVNEVVSRLARELGADGGRESLISVLSGVAGDIDGSARLLSGLVMRGFNLNLLFSMNASATYRDVLERKLSGLPCVRTVDPDDWHRELGRAEAVIAPIIGINALSRLSMLTADGPHSHLLLTALTAGKPLFMVRDCAMVSPGSKLSSALTDRFSTVEQYGATLCTMRDLPGAVDTHFSNSIDHCGNNTLPEQEDSQLPQSAPPLRDRSSAGKKRKILQGRVLTASHVSMAARGGYDIVHEQGAIITPMARDLAAQRGVRLVHG